MTHILVQAARQALQQGTCGVSGRACREKGARCTTLLGRKSSMATGQPPELFPVPGCQKKLSCLVSLYHGPQKKARLMFCHCSVMAGQAFKLNLSCRRSQKPSHRPHSEHLSICFLSNTSNKFTLLYINITIKSISFPITKL